MRRIRVSLVLFVAGVSLAVAAAPSGIAASPVAEAVLRDNQAGQFQLKPPAPVTGHPEIIQPDSQIEPSIAVNPGNPRNAVAAFQEGRVSGGGDETNGFATTLDGGLTWTYGELPCLTYTTPEPRCPVGGPYDRASDAVVAFGPDNVVYANSLIFNDSTGNALRSAIGINVSKDGGRTWSLPIVFQDDNLGGLNDKNWIVVDNSSDPGHKKGRAYAVWDRVDPVVYNYCDAHCDVKANWLPNFLTMSPAQGIGTLPLVLKDGSLAVIYNGTAGSLPAITTGENVVRPGTSNLVMALAPMAGSVPFPAPLTFDQVPFGVSDQQNHAIRFQRASDGLPAADVDPKSGQMYVAWDDSRFRTDGVDDIVYVTSTDGGLMWTTPARINTGPENDWVDHYNAMIAVGTDGSVNVAYRQRQEAADPNHTAAGFSRTIDTYYQRSADGGQTWSAALKANTSAVTDSLYGAFSRNGLFQGDYNEIASGGGLSYIVREESYPTYAGEPPALHLNAAGPDYEADANGLKHIHQRTWVSVVGPASAAGSLPAPEASPTPSGGGVAAGSGQLPPTSGGAPGTAVIVLAAAAAGAALLATRRLQRSS